MMGVRLAEGLSIVGITQRVRSVVGPEAESSLRAAVETWRAQGQLETSGGRWRLTDAGFLLADRVAADLMAAVG